MAERSELHTRNKHNGQYDFSLLTENYPPLRKFVLLNPLGIQTIDFFNPHAVKALNKALLISYYGIRYWDIPRNYLCPPIPGRADYVHYIADLIDRRESVIRQMKRMEISQNDSADAWISVSVQIVFIRLLGTLSMDGCLWVPILIRYP